VIGSSQGRIDDKDGDIPASMFTGDTPDISVSLVGTITVGICSLRGLEVWRERSLGVIVILATIDALCADFTAKGMLIGRTSLTPLMGEENKGGYQAERCRTISIVLSDGVLRGHKGTYSH
jgi:hypothetical protein